MTPHPNEPSDEALAEMLAGLEGVTPGPWYQTCLPWFRCGDGVVAGSPDGNIGFVIADTDDFALPRDEYEGFPLGDKEKDAAHIARCDPATIQYLVTREQERRAAKEERVAVILLNWRPFMTKGAEAQTPFGDLRVGYYAETEGEGWSVGFGDGSDEIGDYPSFEAAKAAAQADYARRILSAIDISAERPAVVVEPSPVVGEWVAVHRAALEWLNGEGPDPAGFWFGDFPEDHPKPAGAFWWRSTFKAIREHYEQTTLSTTPAISATVTEELREAVEVVRGMVRLSDMGFVDSLNEPEEKGNFAAYERAKRFLASKGDL